VSIPIHVDAYAGYRANERPISIWLDPDIDNFTGIYEIEVVEDRWYDSNGEYFKVRTTEGKRYILRYSESENQWTLQSGFDGAELLSRPGIELITVESSAVRQAELKIAGCERCRADESKITFNWIIAVALGKHVPFDFILSEPGRCAN
jgi:hypothetical protein